MSQYTSRCSFDIWLKNIICFNNWISVKHTASESSLLVDPPSGSFWHSSPPALQPVLFSLYFRFCVCTFSKMNPGLLFFQISFSNTNFTANPALIFLSIFIFFISIVIFVVFLSGLDTYSYT